MNWHLLSSLSPMRKDVEHAEYHIPPWLQWRCHRRRNEAHDRNATPPWLESASEVLDGKFDTGKLLSAFSRSTHPVVEVCHGFFRPVLTICKILTVLVKLHQELRSEQTNQEFRDGDLEATSKTRPSPKSVQSSNVAKFMFSFFHRTNLQATNLVMELSRQRKRPPLLVICCIKQIMPHLIFQIDLEVKFKISEIPITRSWILTIVRCVDNFSQFSELTSLTTENLLLRKRGRRMRFHSCR